MAPDPLTWYMFVCLGCSSCGGSSSCFSAGYILPWSAPIRPVWKRGQDVSQASKKWGRSGVGVFGDGFAEWHSFQHVTHSAVPTPLTWCSVHSPVSAEKNIRFLLLWKTQTCHLRLKSTSVTAPWLSYIEPQGFCGGFGLVECLYSSLDHPHCILLPLELAM